MVHWTQTFERGKFSNGLRSTEDPDGQKGAAAIFLRRLMIFSRSVLRKVYEEGWVIKTSAC
jgi:hypothetical protein